MLIKLKNGTWQDMSNVVGLTVTLCKGMSRCYYTILVSMKNGEEFGYKECSDYEEAEKAMDELAEKINAAQGFRIKEKE